MHLLWTLGSPEGVLSNYPCYTSYIMAINTRTLYMFPIQKRYLDVPKHIKYSKCFKMIHDKLIFCKWTFWGILRFLIRHILCLQIHTIMKKLRCTLQSKSLETLYSDVWHVYGLYCLLLYWRLKKCFPEMIFFQKAGSSLNWHWNIRPNGYKLKQIKYLGKYLDKYLNGHY